MKNQKLKCAKCRIIKKCKTGCTKGVIKMCKNRVIKNVPKGVIKMCKTSN